MKQSSLPFQYQGSSSGNFTSFAGLPLFLELSNVCGLKDTIEQKMQLKSQGWTDAQIILSLLLLNIAGGDCVEDIDRLESDSGLRKLLLDHECHGMNRKEKKAHQRRFRKEKTRAFPSVSVIRRYLETFHNEAEEENRIEGTAFIPQSNTSLKALSGLNQRLLDFMQSRNPSEGATLDQDATLAETNKSKALFCYKKFKAYQPFNTYWAEQGVLVHSEFRDGNVNAGLEQKRLLEESLEVLPSGIKKVKLRSDSAGYQEKVIRYCSEGKSECFGVIEFAIAVKVTQAFKGAVFQVPEKDWQPLYKDDDATGSFFKTEQEWAEVSFVPSWVKSKKTPDYRFIAIREHLSPQRSLPGIEPIQRVLPFPTMLMRQLDYKVFGVITNRTIPGNDLINWHRKRCGDSEKVHSIEKTDLAGGQFPSDKFGANAAWWHIMVLAFNLKALMQKLVLPKEMAKQRMKALRFHLINIAGCVVTHARRMLINVSHDPMVINLLQHIRKKLLALTHPPPKMSFQA